MDLHQPARHSQLTTFGNLFFKAVFLLILAPLLLGCDGKPKQEQEASSAQVSETPVSVPDSTTAPATPAPAVSATDSGKATIDPLLLEEADSSLANARARYLAGLPATGTTSASENQLQQLRDSTFWKAHAAKTNASWQNFNRHRRAVKSWADTALAVTRNQESVFYPFSGPDFTHVYTLFPHAKDYLLIGLEPVGDLPALEAYPPDEQRAAFKRLSKALSSILTSSFFITKDMDTVLRGRELRGTAPILQFFMVRSGCQVLGYELLRLTADGQLVPPPATGLVAIRIRFLNADGLPAQLTYVQGNLNNAGLKSLNPGLATFIKNRPEGITYLKSASYLLHSSNFTSIRSLILDKSNHLLQDDSGMPFRYLSSAPWQLRLFGQYTGTIRLFAHRHQQDLLQAYQDSASAGKSRPLQFRLGYGRKEQINLLLASKVKP